MLDPRLGRWLQRDPAGYVDGMSLYEYCGGGPLGCSDPMGLQNAAIDGLVCSNAQFQDNVMAAFHNGDITNAQASELIRKSSEGVLEDIATAEELSNRWDVKLNAGLKGNANSAVDTVVSFASGGTIDGLEVFSVNEYERGAGYDKSYFVGRIFNEAAFVLVTRKIPGKAGSFLGHMDSIGGVVTASRGGYDAFQNGLSFGNGAQIVGGLVGVRPDAVRKGLAAAKNAVAELAAASRQSRRGFAYIPWGGSAPSASGAPAPRIRPNPVTAQPRTAPGFKADPHSNVTARPRTVDQFLTDAETFLGRGYRQGADGQFYSSDWSRRARFTPSDLAGHKGGPSHGHFEFNGGRNIHIPLTDK